MNRMRSILIFLLSLIVLNSCFLGKKASTNQGFVIPKKYMHFQLVQKSDLMILTHTNEITSKYPDKILDLIIYDTNKKVEIFNDQYRNGNLEWINDHTIKVSFTPGNPQKGVDYFFYYDLDAKLKQPQPFQQK